jgi:hypothetical protein
VLSPFKLWLVALQIVVLGNCVVVINGGTVRQTLDDPNRFRADGH